MLIPFSSFQLSLGEVYRVRERSSGQIAALKKVKAKCYEVEEGLPPTLVREISLFRSVNHPNTLKLLHLSQMDTELCLIFELLTRDLHSLLDRFDGYLSPQLVKVCSNHILSMKPTSTLFFKISQPTIIIDLGHFIVMPASIFIPYLSTLVPIGIPFDIIYPVPHIWQKNIFFQSPPNSLLTWFYLAYYYQPPLPIL